jgi:hypothetical protein
VRSGRDVSRLNRSGKSPHRRPCVGWPATAAVCGGRLGGQQPPLEPPHRPPDPRQDRQHQQALGHVRVAAQGRLRGVAHEADDVVADREHRQPLHRLLQPQGQGAAFVDAAEALAALVLHVHGHPCRQQVHGAGQLPRQRLAALVDGAAGPHGRGEASLEELRQRLAAVDGLLLQARRALPHQLRVGAAGGEAVGELRGDVGDGRGHGEQLGEHGLLVVAGVGVGHGRDGGGEPPLQGRQARCHLPRQGQAEQREGAVDLLLQQPLHEPSGAHGAHGAVVHQDSGAAVVVDAEVGPDLRVAVVDEPAAEGVVEEAAQVRRLVAGVDDGQARGGDQLARQLAEPGRVERRGVGAGQRSGALALDEEREAGELVVLLEAQRVLGEAGDVQVGVGLRGRQRGLGAQPLDGPAGGAAGVGGLSDRYVADPGRRAQRQKRAIVQLPGEDPAIGVGGGQGHRHLLRRFAARFVPGPIDARGAGAAGARSAVTTA